MVTGGEGSGKTILVAALVRDLLADQATGLAGDDRDGGPAGGETFVVGTISDPSLCRTDVQFLRAILGQFGVPAGGRTGLDLLTRFQRALVGDTGDGIPTTGTLAGTPLLIIDDAASLAGSHFEILRGLLAFGDVAGPRAPRVVLLGRPELTDKVGRKRNLASRVTMSHALNPINEEDTVALLTRRIAVATGQTTGVAGGIAAGASSPRFSPAAIVAIGERAGGVPAAILRAASATFDLATRSGRATVEAST
ncbi:MAG: AAA family ATPase, partial [Chloroflexota bacterium]|nr:AAA family ATPase [Chloroflexota bacterium]